MNVFVKIIYIMVGGALGSGARYWFSGLAQRMIHGTFPLGTLAVNCAGSLIAGLLWGLTEYFEFPPRIRLFTFIGFLGGFTTFSTFSLETMNLLRTQRYFDAGINIIATNFLGLFFVIAGFMFTRFLLNQIK